jgi:nucleotide-binding universal stress UspA family protein
MFRSLLVPLDGTPETERSVPVASCLARSVGSEVTLVRVFPAAAEAHTSKLAFPYLQRIARQLPPTGARVGMQVRTGSTADSVLSGVELTSADLLVIATSLCELKQIVLRTRVPVVLVPKHHHIASWTTRVLAPVDSSGGETLAFRAATELAHRTRAELLLLRVIVRTDPRPNERRREFQDVCVASSAAGGDFCDAILEASARLDPDIVVMGISEFVQRIPLSSVDAAAVPMLLIPDAPASRHLF